MKVLRARLNESGALARLPEARFHEGVVDSSPRFLVSLFLRNRPELLATVLDVLDEGVSVPTPLKAVRFSIDGSLSSAIRGAFVLAFVVTPLTPDGREIGPESGLESSWVRRPLERKLLKAVARLTREPVGSFRERVKVMPFQGIDSDIFSDKRFTEYRFGIRAADTRGSDVIAAQACLLKEFTRALGGKRTPIAYLHFPDSVETDDSSWVRVAVGAPASADESFELDLLALDLSKRHGCLFGKYDPGMPSVSFGERFRTIADFSSLAHEPRNCCAGSLEPDETQDSADRDVVFVEGPARAGFVAGMLAGPVGNRVLGGSMTVLGGHTLSSWIVPRNLGDGLVAEIESLPDSIDGPSQVFAASVPTNVELDHESCVIWVAWWLVDQPGVFRQIVRAIRAGLADYERTVSLPMAPREIDFRYSVTRVLASGTCAGKVKFSITNSSVAERDQISEQIDARLGSMISELALTLGDLPPDHVSPHIVRSSEPGEEPWASRVYLG